MKKDQILKEILLKELLRAQARNPRYSLRALAKNMSISPATLSRVLAGKSNLSKSMADRIVDRLKIDVKEKEKLQQSEHDPYVADLIESDIKAITENWFYSPIVCLAETKEFHEDPKWIASRLGISVTQAKSALARLLKIGLLKRNEAGKLVATDMAISTSARKKNHFDKNSLDKVELVRRNLIQASPDIKEISDVSSIIVATSPKKMAEAKKRIKRFRRSLAKFLDSGEKTEVYLIFIQLIPVSKNCK